MRRMWKEFNRQLAEGGMTREIAEKMMLCACYENGMVRDYGRAEVVRRIKVGLDLGIARREGKVH
jgi:hypothetical protein